MVLPAGVTLLGSFKGAKGDKGDPGTFASASATSIPAGETASVIITGPNGENVEFRIPRGLPGVNAIENDTAVATYVDAVDSDTRAAVNTVVNTLADLRTKVTDGGTAAGAGGPLRPNVQIGGLINGSIIEPSQIHGVILQPGGPGFNNIIGGDGTLTVNTTTPNAADPSVGNCGVSLIGGYDNVAGQISSKIIADHSYTAPGGSGHSAIYGGTSHIIRTAGNHSMVAGGDRNIIGGPYSFATGQLNRVEASGAVVGGRSNAIETSAASAVVFGSENVAEGVFTQLFGRQNKSLAAATGGSAVGANGISRTPFQQVIAPGKNAVDGDAQTSVCAYRLLTTDATSRALVAAYTGVGTGSQFVVQPGQSVAFTAVVVGRIAGGATAVALEIKGLAQRPTSGNAVIVGTPTTTVIYQPDALVTASMAINATTGHLSILVKGTAGVDIRWAARLTTTEVIA